MNLDEVAGSSDQRRYASLALEITEQDWSMLGLEDELCPKAAASTSLELTTERVTSILLIRLIALAAPSHHFSDLSTTTICRTIVESQYITSCWPENITETVIRELRCLVRAILKGYNDVPYHNFEHAYHVIISANKLMDLILQSKSGEQVRCSSKSLRFEEDPLMHLSLLFAALIHDVEHQGIPNQQLVMENDPLALQYNDQSVAEQRSLSVGFTELLKADYDELRHVMFPFTFAGDGYRRFRETVTNLILATDMASPERGESVRKKWDTIFGHRPAKTRVIQTGERKAKKKSTKSLLIKPPRGNPATTRSRKVVKQKAVPQKPYLESWMMELGATKSTHFPPRDNAGSSMHDSLVFWWFCPDKPSDEDDESDGHSFAEDDPAFASRSAQSLEPSHGSLDINHFDRSISLFEEIEKPVKDAEMPDEFFYPHASQSSQLSCSPLEEEADLQHLLSPSKLNRVISRRGGNLSSGSSRGSGTYCDLSGALKEHIEAQKSRSKSFLLGALNSCTPKRKSKIKSSAVCDLQSMISKCNAIDLMNSSHTLDLTEGTDMSFDTMTTSKIQSDSSQEVATTSGRSERALSCDSFLNGSETVPLKAQQEEGEYDEELCTQSLLEHILLVSDVAHTMQGWDIMIKFAHRRSEEIQAATDVGRSGGIIDDPLSDWYNNQSAFLHRYVLSLAERLEKTGYIPVLDDRKEALLSSSINSNLTRWQEQGHDVISAWRKQKAQKVIKAKDKVKKKKSRKEKASSGGKQKHGESKKRRSHRKSRQSIASEGTLASSIDELMGKIQMVDQRILEPFASLEM